MVITVASWVMPIVFFSNVISHVSNGTIVARYGICCVLLSYLLFVVVYCCVLWIVLVRISFSCVVRSMVYCYVIMCLLYIVIMIVV